MTPTKQPDSALAVADAGEATVLERWEALSMRIAEASEEDEQKTFDYSTPADNRAARSWVAQLRKIKARIEASRKEAKAVHLERGRAVDGNAKALTESVEALIARHAEPIAALEAAEAARVAAHRDVLRSIELLAQGVDIQSAEQARASLEKLDRIDPAGLEEFAEQAAAAIAEARPVIVDRVAELERREAEQAELEALRAQKAAQDEADRLERIRREAVERDRLARAAEAERQRLEAEELARREREQAAQREAEARAAAIAAERRAAEAEQAAAAAAAREQLREREQQAAEAAAAEAKAKRRADLGSSLAMRLTELGGPRQAAEAILDGSFHPAIAIDWSKA